MNQVELNAYYAKLEAEGRCPFCELVCPCAHFDAAGNDVTGRPVPDWIDIPAGATNREVTIREVVKFESKWTS